MAHLVAGKQVELLSDEQVAALLVKHLPAEAPRLLPPEILAATRAQGLLRALPSQAAVPARSAALVGSESALVAESSWMGLLGVATLAIGGTLFYHWWMTHP